MLERLRALTQSGDLQAAHQLLDTARRRASSPDRKLAFDAIIQVHSLPLNTPSANSFSHNPSAKLSLLLPGPNGLCAVADDQGSFGIMLFPHDAPARLLWNHQPPKDVANIRWNVIFIDDETLLLHRSIQTEGGFSRYFLESVVTLHDVITGEELETFSFPENSDLDGEEINVIALYREDNLLLLGCDSGLCVYDLDGDELRWSHMLEDGMPDLVLHPNRAEILITSSIPSHDILGVYSLKTGALLSNMEIYWIYTLSLHSDGDRVAIASGDSPAEIWSLSKEKLLKRLPPSCVLQSIHWTQTGDIIGRRPDGVWVLCELSSEEVREITPPRSKAQLDLRGQRMIFPPREACLAKNETGDETAERETRVLLYSWAEEATGALSHEDPPNRILPVTKSDGVVTLTGKTLRFWWPDQEELLWEWSALGEITALLFDERGDLWVSDESQTVTRLSDIPWPDRRMPRPT